MSMRTYDATPYASPGDYQTTDSRDESVSVFDRYSSFDGTFNLTRDLRVEGQVKGTINCQGTFFVAQGAQVSAAVEAENITVAGDLNGDVVCRGKLQILESGKVRGKITTATLVINEGAFYEGELVMDAGQGYGSGGRQRSERPERAERQAPVSTATATPITPETRSSEPGSAQSPSGGNTFIRRFGGQETTWDTIPAQEGEPSDT
jgi:cytoskeletal protein CcmA (bactofilin family)